MVTFSHSHICSETNTVYFPYKTLCTRVLPQKERILSRADFLQKWDETDKLALAKWKILSGRRLRVFQLGFDISKGAVYTSSLVDWNGPA